jgi:hypothetical protein
MLRSPCGRLTELAPGGADGDDLIAAAQGARPLPRSETCRCGRAAHGPRQRKVNRANRSSRPRFHVGAAKIEDYSICVADIADARGLNGPSLESDRRRQLLRSRNNETRGLPPRRRTSLSRDRPRTVEACRNKVWETNLWKRFSGSNDSNFPRRNSICDLKSKRRAAMMAALAHKRKKRPDGDMGSARSWRRSNRRRTDPNPNETSSMRRRRRSTLAAQFSADRPAVRSALS